MKKVLLIVIDAFGSRVIRPAMEQSKLPHLRALAEAGGIDWKCTAIFPSITPAATAALVTGGYPNETGISGAYFYDQAADRVHYYGDDIWPIMRRGFSAFLDDFLVRLNRDQLRIPTTFQIVERSGKKAACLNYLWFRGDVKHRVRMPWLMRLWPGVKRSKTVSGPSLLSLGDFVSDPIDAAGKRLKGPGGVLHRLGFGDAATADQLLLLARRRLLPDFTVAYFPDNDFDSHTHGAEAAVSTVAKVDETLGQLSEAYGGLDAMLEVLAIIVTGDHAQSDLPLDRDATGIRLDEMLKDYNIVPAGKNWREEDELMICPNMRAVQLYLRAGYWKQRAELVARLLGDDRVDQVMWRDEDAQGARRLHVQTARSGLLKFSAGSWGNESARDEYGQCWSWQGDLGAVDARVNHLGVLEFGTYPNALERIAAAFDERVSGDLWATSRLGFEFRLAETSVHRRGSHGSLHADDSHSPLIMAGIADSQLPRATARSVDIAPLCLALLGLQSRHRVGSSHITAE